jgi:hypothetical protein
MKTGRVPVEAGNVYTRVSGVDLSSLDWTPNTNVDYCAGIIMSGAGNIKFDMYHGGTITLPIPAVTNGFYELKNYLISKIYKTGTTTNIICTLY